MHGVQPFELKVSGLPVTNEGKITKLPIRTMKIPLLIVVLAIVLTSHGARASDNPRSLALKDRSPAKNPFHIDPDHTADELWDEFMLVKNANSGDPVAQHELGLRYLLGKGFHLLLSV